MSVHRQSPLAPGHNVLRSASCALNESLAAERIGKCILVVTRSDVDGMLVESLN